MKVDVETVSKAVDSEKMSVSSSWTGEIKLSFGDNAFFFDPKDAVELWRVLKGEKAHAEIQYVRHGLLDKTGKVCIKYEDDDGFKFKWKLCFAEYFCVILDANEALALAWAIEGQVSAVIWGANENVRPVLEPPNKVWVLSCRRVLTGDSSENVESERIGGYERLYWSEGSARDNVREFIRDLVNESYSESFWDSNSVDEILDKILDGSPRFANGTQYWTHDGQTQSFEVKLGIRKIEK